MLPDVFCNGSISLIEIDVHTISDAMLVKMPIAFEPTRNHIESFRGQGVSIYISFFPLHCLLIRKIYQLQVRVVNNILAASSLSPSAMKQLIITPPDLAKVFF